MRERGNDDGRRPRDERVQGEHIRLPRVRQEPQDHPGEGQHRGHREPEGEGRTRRHHHRHGRGSRGSRRDLPRDKGLRRREVHRRGREAHGAGTDNTELVLIPRCPQSIPDIQRDRTPRRHPGRGSHTPLLREAGRARGDERLRRQSPPLGGGNAGEQDPGTDEGRLRVLPQLRGGRERPLHQPHQPQPPGPRPPPPSSTRAPGRRPEATSSSTGR